MRCQIDNLVAEAAGARPDAPALTFKGVTLTYAQLWREVGGFGATLRGLGLCRGDRVAVYLEKRLETVTALFGTSAGGGVFVPVNPLLRPKQVGYIMQDCDARVLVTSPKRLALLREELEECKSVEQVVLVGDAGAAAVEQGERYTVSCWPTDPESGFVITADVIDEDMAAILYTSGSTGRPKGVVLSHHNLIAGAESVSQLPRQHSGRRDPGRAATQLRCGIQPAHYRVQCGRPRCAHELPPACGRRAALRPAPGNWADLCSTALDPDRRPGLACRGGQNIRYFANTGGRMPKAILDRLRSLFPGAAPFLMYGLTEAFRSTYLDPAEVEQRPASIGKAIPNAEILVVRRGRLTVRARGGR